MLVKNPMTEPVVAMHAAWIVNDEEVHAYLARPASRGLWPGIILLHEYWGLDSHFRDLTRRFAAEGFVALTPDLYRGELTDDPGRAALLKSGLDLDWVVEMIVQARSYVTRLPFVAHQIGLVGYCMGGGAALLVGSRTDGWGSIVAYFPSIYPDAESLAAIRYQVLLHYGTEDTVTPRYEIDRIVEVLRQNKVLEALYEYEGAGHAFMNDLHPEHFSEEAAEASWPRTIEFLERTLRGQQPDG